MKNPTISICIPVYNQIALVDKLIRNIVQYKGNDIEIVVSDDCSTEDIYKMVRKVNDNRIKYYRNTYNLGHDLNIINSFKKASGNFAFLLRSRDNIIVENLDTLIDILNNNQNISYLTGEAVTEENQPRIKYAETKLFVNVEDCIGLHYSLYCHPSGSIYNLKKLDLDFMEKFIKNNIETKYSFIAHNLMRSLLALQGYFYLLKKPTWVYSDTSKSRDVAVNKMPNGSSVYSPNLILKRYEAEMKWNLLIIPKENSDFKRAFLELYKHYLYQITWGQRRRNRNKGLNNHYQSRPTKSSVLQDSNKILNSTIKILDASGVEVPEIRNYKCELKKILIKNSTLGMIRYFGACLLDFFCIKEVFDQWRNNHENKY